jgi:hypothetical protein
VVAHELSEGGKSENASRRLGKCRLGGERYEERWTCSSEPSQVLLHALNLPYFSRIPRAFMHQEPRETLSHNLLSLGPLIDIRPIGCQHRVLFAFR